MKLCIVQTEAICGDIARNIEKHQSLVSLAASCESDMVLFPELSLTGYEPTLANELAIDAADERLDVFQAISDKKQLVIGVGVPTRVDDGLCISMILFRPNQSRHVYSKKYLHADEKPFFISGRNFPVLELGELSVALAICYEVFVPAHAQAAYEANGQIYVASVAKAEGGMKRAAVRAPEIAKATGMSVMIANCLGLSDDFVGAGRSAVWGADGRLLAQLDAEVEGLLMYDTETQEVVEKLV